MTTFAMKQKNDQWVPIVVPDLRPGDIYKLVINGEPQELRRALATPMPVMRAGSIVDWRFESEPVPEALA